MIDKITEEQGRRARRDGFVEDYTLVVDNDQNGWHEALEIAREANGNVAVASDKFKEQFQDAIYQVVEREREQGNALIADLIAQLLIGWGSDAFDSIARHYIDTDLEHRLVERLTSVLKTGN
jgi:hypothetical protein